MTELLLTAGRVHVFDDDRTVAAAVLFRDGRVAAVGDDETVREAATDPETIDLDGQTVLPGFNDAHAHFLSVGIDSLEADLADADSREAAVDALRAEAATRPAGEWVVGHNYDESTWTGDETPLGRDELDAVSEDHPVAAFQVTGHVASVNSPALERLPLDGHERDVRTDAMGEPTGVLVEDAAGVVKQATFPEGERAREALRLAGDRALELGVTSVQHVSGLTAPAEHGSPIQRAFFDAWRAGDLPVRITFYVHSEKGSSLADLELASGFGDEWLRIGGLKTFADGALGARTAKRSEPYPGDGDNDGTWTTTPEALEALFADAARANQQVVTHALGDQAIETVLSLYEELLPEYREDPRLRIEHLELATDDQLERIADAGIVASMQPNFLQWAGEGGIYERVLGADARGANNRFRDVVDAGATLAFGSDTMPMDPLWGIHNAVNAPHESQRLTVDDAIAAYTQGAAYAEGTDDWKGTLETGMAADAVVLDAEPHETPEAVDEREVAMTVVDGEVRYRSE
jgi:predicted amidohydrolase YtcJ